MKTYDTGDLDAVQALAKERGYELLRDKMRQSIEQYVNELIQPQTAEKTAELRGAIVAVRMCLLLPKILEREIRKAIGLTDG